jgi:Zn-dependent protease with chaperone function
VEDTAQSKAGLVVLLLLLPVLIWITGWYTRHHLNQFIVDIAEAEFGPLTARQRERIHLSVLCQDPEVSKEDICFYYQAGGWLQWGSFLSAVGGLGLLWFVNHQANQSRNHYEQLPQRFRQAVQAAGLGAGCLGVTLTVLLAGALALVMVIIAERIWVGLLIGIVIVGGAAALSTASAALSWGKPLEHTEIASIIGWDDAPRLWRLIHEVAQDIGTSPPDNLILTLDPSCYAVEVPVTTPDGQLDGRTLCLSLGLLYLFDERELRAVIAHELAHFHGEGTRYSREYAPTFRAAADALENLRQSLGRDLRALGVLPLLPIFAFTIERFAHVTAEHSREREFLADETAAHVAGSTAIATALAKVAVAAITWRVYLRQFLEDPDDAPPAASAFAWLSARILDEFLPPPWLATGKTPHPIDTHPPLEARFEALGLTLQEVWLNVKPAPVAAATLVPDIVELEAELFAHFQTLTDLLRRVLKAKETQSSSTQ